MDKLEVLSEETSGTLTIKTYDLNHYRTLPEADQERIWKRLSSLTLERCPSFGEPVLMEYLEDSRTHTFQGAFKNNVLVAFQIKGDDNLTDPDEPEETLSTFVCPYETRIFGEPGRRARAARGMAEAARPGSVLPRLPEAVEANIGSYLTGIRRPTVQEQLDVLKSQTGQSRINRKTRRSKGKRRNTKRGKLRNLTSRRR